MCPFAGVSRCKRFDTVGTSLLARRVRAFTAGLPLCPDELKVWINPVALIRQELVFGERRPQVAQSRRLRRGETGTFLAAQAIDSHMLLELELLLLVPVTSCSEYTVSRRCAVIMRLLTTRGAQLSSCMSRVRICAVIPTQHTPTPPTYCLLTGSKISLKNRVESFRIAKIFASGGAPQAGGARL